MAKRIGFLMLFMRQLLHDQFPFHISLEFLLFESATYTDRFLKFHIAVSKICSFVTKDSLHYTNDTSNDTE